MLLLLLWKAQDRVWMTVDLLWFYQNLFWLPPIVMWSENFDKSAMTAADDHVVVVVWMNERHLS